MLTWLLCLIPLMGGCAYHLSPLPQSLHTPLHSRLPWAKLHQSVVLELCEDTPPYTVRHYYVLDFVPDVYLSADVLLRLFMGKTVPGKLRWMHFPVPPAPAPANMTYADIARDFQPRIDNGHYESQVDTIGAQIGQWNLDGRMVTAWDMNYHLYRNNCWHFCNSFMVEMSHRRL